MGPSAALLDVLVALLQSMVVLLLASGVYVALVVRKADDSPIPAKPGQAPSPQGNRRLTAPQGDSPETQAARAG